MMEEAEEEEEEEELRNRHRHFYMTTCKTRSAHYKQCCTQEKAKRKEKTENVLNDLRAGSLLLTKHWDNRDPQ